MPPLVRGELLGSKVYLRRHAELELVVRNLKERKQLANGHTDVLFVDQCMRELQGAVPDRDVAVPEAVEDDVAVALDRVWYIFVKLRSENILKMEARRV